MSVAERIAMFGGGVNSPAVPAGPPQADIQQQVEERVEAVAESAVAAVSAAAAEAAPPQVEVAAEAEAVSPPVVSRPRSKTEGGQPKARGRGRSFLRTLRRKGSGSKDPAQDSPPSTASNGGELPKPAQAPKRELSADEVAAREEKTQALLDENHRAYQAAVRALGAVGEFACASGGDEATQFLLAGKLKQQAGAIEEMAAQLQRDVEGQVLSAKNPEYSPANRMKDQIMDEMAGKLSEFLAQLRALHTALSSGDALLNIDQEVFCEALATFLASSTPALLENRAKALKEAVNSSNERAVGETCEIFRTYFETYRDLQTAYIKCIGIKGAQVEDRDGKPIYFEIRGRMGESIRWQATTDGIPSELYKYSEIFERLSGQVEIVKRCREESRISCKAEAILLEKLGELSLFLDEILGHANSAAAISS